MYDLIIRRGLIGDGKLLPRCWGMAEEHTKNTVQPIVRMIYFKYGLSVRANGFTIICLKFRTG